MRDFVSRIPLEGLSISIRESFAGLKHIGILGVVHNKVNPRLVFYPDEIEHKVIFTGRKSYKDIQMVDLPLGVLGKVLFSFRGSLQTFTVWPKQSEDVILILSVCQAKGVPLSERAQQYLAG